MGTKKRTLPRRYQQDFLETLDRRTELYANLARSYHEILTDLGDNPSRLEQSLAERFVFVEFLLRKLEVQIASNGHSRDTVDRWWRLNNSLNSLAAKLGIRRRVTPDDGAGLLEKYIEGSNDEHS